MSRFSLFHRYTECHSEACIQKIAIPERNNQNEIQETTPKETSGEETLDDIELRILEFLDQEGVEMKSPYEKMFDYFDNVRKKAGEEEIHSQTCISEDSSKSKEEKTMSPFCLKIKSKKVFVHSNPSSPRSKDK